MTNELLTTELNDLKMKLAVLENEVRGENGLLKQIKQLRIDYRKLSRNQNIAIGCLAAVEILLKFIPLPL